MLYRGSFQSSAHQSFYLTDESVRAQGSAFECRLLNGANELVIFTLLQLCLPFRYGASDSCA